MRLPVIAGIVIAVSVSAGCGYLKREGAALTGWTRTCVEGVTYLQFPSGVTVQYDPAGKVVACK